MSGTYEIVSKVPDSAKFACYVKFNEAIDPGFYADATKYPNGGEYWSHDSNDPAEIAAAIQKTADDDAAHWESVAAGEAQAAAVVIENGQIVL